MIAMLSGVIDQVLDGAIVLDVNGVGYLVFVAKRLFIDWPAPGSRLKLFVETQVREDRIALYGFNDPAERDWFRLLCGVHGVGPRTAMAVLSALSPETLSAAVDAGDQRVVARADGVGIKLARRIVDELRSKRGENPSAISAPASPAATASAEAMSALRNLGYADDVSRPAVAKATSALGPGAKREEIVRKAMRGLAGA